MSEDSSTIQTVEDTVKRVGGITDLTPNQDFYDAGLTSLASLTLLLELEDAFNIGISDERFINCRSVNDIVLLIEELK
ncbi:MAG TPA: phosphopantetheine-binding protein [Acidobacteriaceae bacterium]|nr:phosphopantetheine-binding protein [Acidobacteriaceae bacterium]